MVKARNWASSATWVMVRPRAGQGDLEAEADHQQGGDLVHGGRADHRGAPGWPQQRGQGRVERGVEDVAGQRFDGGVDAGEHVVARRHGEERWKCSRWSLVGGQLVAHGGGQGVDAGGESVGGVGELAPSRDSAVRVKVSASAGPPRERRISSRSSETAAGLMPACRNRDREAFSRSATLTHSTSTASASAARWPRRSRGQLVGVVAAQQQGLPDRFHHGGGVDRDGHRDPGGFGGSSRGGG